MSGQIRLLTAGDADAYRRFRQAMWPTYAVIGSWDVACIKYLENPLCTQVPGAGLYVFEQKGEFFGVMGAYPMRVKHRGQEFPGHLLVDWAVPRAFQTSPVAGLLYAHCSRLPGIKLGSHGTQDSQGALARRAKKMPAFEGWGVVRPLAGLALQRQGLIAYAQPAPIDPEPPTGWTWTESPGTLQKDAETYAHKPTELWRHWAAHPQYTGAITLASESPKAELIARLTQVGRHRILDVLEFVVEPSSPEAIGQAVRSLRSWVELQRVALIHTALGDSAHEALVTGLSVRVARRETHWWHLPKADDPFDVAAASWRLTLADRDSHWGIAQVSAG